MNGAASPVARAPVSAWQGAPWARWVGLAGAALLGLVLLVAAWAKLLDPEAFARQIELEGLDLLLPSLAVAFVALGLEVALGFALVAGVRRLWVLLPAALLVAFFLALNGRAWWLDAQGLRAEAAACGCFGNLIERTPEEAFWQDLLLLLPALLLAFVGREGGRAFPRWRTGAVALLTAAALGFAWEAPELPLDDLATRLKPGVRVEELCAGRGEARICMGLLLPEIRDGEHWVMLVDLTDEGFAAAVPALNEHVFRGAAPPLWALTAAEPEALTAFRWSRGPVFDIREAPPSLLAPLYRRLPRSFRVEDGEVVATYRGLPPLAEPAGSPAG